MSGNAYSRPVRGSAGPASRYLTCHGSADTARHRDSRFALIAFCAVDVDFVVVAGDSGPGRNHQNDGDSLTVAVGYTRDLARSL